MKVPKFWKVFFGFQLLKAAKIVYEDQQELRERKQRFHGYPWPQVENLLATCYRTRPDIQAHVSGLPKDEILAFIAGVLTCSPAQFRREFGFDRPSPY